MFEVFFVLGLTILIGFLALVLFERTRISQVLILIAFGFLLGPVLHVVDVSPSSIIISILPFISTLALIVLLFDAGLSIDIFSVARAIPRSTIFTLLAFCVSVAFVTAFTMLFLHWPMLYGVLLGAVTGGTSSAIVIAMVEHARLGTDTRSILTVESTMTDALCIIVGVMTLQLIVADVPPNIITVAGLLFSAFSVAVVLGSVCAILWIAIATRFAVSKYSYMLTMALVFGMYSLAEALHGNGGFTVFIFGMILGNSRELGALLLMGRNFVVSPMIGLFQEEITFFVRTFFFVYLGLLLAPSYFSPLVILVTVALLALFLLARLAIQKLVLPDLPFSDRRAVVAMLPRGLAAAVLAALPAASGVVIPFFQELVFGVILLTNIAATLGIFVIERGLAKAKPAQGD
jgi:cell volume regulation protein A